jgi:phospholipid transport system substrate-binding protein
MIKKLSSIIFALALLINNVLAIEADIFVQSTVNRASQLLSENISKEEKIEKLKLIAKDTVDIEGIGFYTLGSARKDLNDDQKKEYSVKFEEYFLGLSLARTQKEEFASVLSSNNGDINALFKTLEEFSNK